MRYRLRTLLIVLALGPMGCGEHSAPPPVPQSTLQPKDALKPPEIAQPQPGVKIEPGTIPQGSFPGLEP